MYVLSSFLIKLCIDIYFTLTSDYGLTLHADPFSVPIWLSLISFGKPLNWFEIGGDIGCFPTAVYPPIPPITSHVAIIQLNSGNIFKHDSDVPCWTNKEATPLVFLSLNARWLSFDNELHSSGCGYYPASFYIVGPHCFLDGFQFKGGNVKLVFLNIDVVLFGCGHSFISG